MKLTQGKAFKPVVIRLETRDEVITFWALIAQVKKTTESDDQYAMAVELSNWLQEEEKI